MNPCFWGELIMVHTYDHDAIAECEPMIRWWSHQEKSIPVNSYMGYVITLLKTYIQIESERTIKIRGVFIVCVRVCEHPVIWF